jgi:YhcH/YjgK/YiaL family protein
MIADHLKNWRKLPGFSKHPVWTEAFEWIEAYAATAELGFHELNAEGAKVRVMEYDLKERGEARYENHKQTIDLQFTIEGAEGIEIHPTEQLIPSGDYLADKDFQFYEPIGKGTHRVDNLKGSFCVLYPQDGHMPQLFVNGHSNVRKLVVKIPIALLTIDD